MYREIEGDLIELAKKGEFDVITHGCNCLCTMGAGIAPQMARAFNADKLPKEKEFYKGDINKLGTIDYGVLFTGGEMKDYHKGFHENIVPSSVYKSIKGLATEVEDAPDWDFERDNGLLFVVNSYTQYSYGRNHSDGVKNPLDYEALQLCLRKINKVFKGKKIGLPKIGCGLAGGNWSIVKKLIKAELADCDVTIVIYNK